MGEHGWGAQAHLVGGGAGPSAGSQRDGAPDDLEPVRKHVQDHAVRDRRGVVPRARTCPVEQRGREGKEHFRLASASCPADAAARRLAHQRPDEASCEEEKRVHEALQQRQGSHVSKLASATRPRLHSGRVRSSPTASSSTIFPPPPGFHPPRSGPFIVAEFTRGFRWLEWFLWLRLARFLTSFLFHGLVRVGLKWDA